MDQDSNSIYDSDREQVVFLPVTTLLTGDDMKVRSRGFLVASRSKEGGKWGFVDGAGFEDPSAFQIVFPGLPTDIPIPEVGHELVDE